MAKTANGKLKTANGKLKTANGKLKRMSNPVPAEGEDGLFTQTWWPVAWSTDVAPGQVIGRDFLDGRIVVFRGANGKAVATSAYCPHVGADLAVGEVIGDNIRCAFHHWQYDQTGKCVKTGIGDKPPKGACLFVFPILERYGIIWVFNGEKPLFDMVSLPIPDDELVMGPAYEAYTINCDPWVFSANTPDMQHIKVLHKVTFNGEDPHKLVKWSKFGFEYTYKGIDQGGVLTDYTLGIQGTNIFFRYGMYEDFWRGSIAGFALPRPGKLMMYSINLVPKGPNAEKNLETATWLSNRTLSEDRDIMNTLHYKPGHLTRGDTSLSKFLNYLRKYPRAHPSAEFIR
jgi:phenylpropionate dioxygenase-like ring-hydroxylating dioxygenase large terminal subunit